MKIVFIFIITFCLQSLALLQDLQISIGEETRLPLSSTKIWIEDSKILKAESFGSELKIFGVKEGSSLLSIGEKKYHIFVLSLQKQNSYSLLQQILEKTVGLNVVKEKGMTVVQGELFRIEDWKRLANSLENRDVDYQMAAKMTAAVEKEAQDYFDQLFEKTKLPKLTLVFDQGVSYRLKSAHPLASTYRRILLPYGIQLMEDASAIIIEPSIRIQITVAEVQRQLTQKLGLRWPDAYQATLLPTGAWNYSNADAVAHFFEQSGQGRILASPNLISKSGKEAEFQAGGEFPIKVTSYKNQNVVWKKYGIILKVKPEADSLGHLTIQINTEISSLDPSKAIDGIPGLITHRVTSQFDLSKPQTIALSGLIKNEESVSKDGLPYLSRIPLLSSLFSSRDFKENRTELIIFVRPEIIDLQTQELPPTSHLKEPSL